MQAQLRAQCEALLAGDGVDFIICEYIEYVEEMEWAIEVARGSALPVVASMCISEQNCRRVTPEVTSLRMCRYCGRHGGRADG